MRYFKLIISVFVILVLSTAMNAMAASIPLMIPYSGTIAVDGAPFNGDGQFKFAVINGHADCQLKPTGPGCVIYWSNDSELIDGSKEPKDHVILPSTVQDVVSNGIPVSNGIFSIKLGDTSLTNMQALPEGLFDSPTTYLRIWFNDGVTGFQQLSPDRQLVSVPYAFRADAADQFTGTISSSQIAAGAVGTTQIGDSSVATTDLAFDPATQAELDAHKGGGDHDSRYPAKTDLSSAGTINTATNPVDWTKLKSVPAGFADGVDNTGTSYTAGTGIDSTALLTGTIKIADGGVGTTQIADNSVASAKIAADAVGTTQIADGTVTAAKINPTGLDADTVDGQHASAFVSKAGDTMTGGLTIPSLTYSTPKTTSVTYAAVGFLPSDETLAYSKQHTNNGYVYSNSGTGMFISPLTIPAGVKITGIECRCFDNTATGNVSVNLRSGVFPGSMTTIASISTTIAETPLTVTLSNLTIDHVVLPGPLNFYEIDVTLSEANGSLGFFAVTIHYQYTSP